MSFSIVVLVLHRLPLLTLPLLLLQHAIGGLMRARRGHLCKHPGPVRLWESGTGPEGDEVRQMGRNAAQAWLARVQEQAGQGMVEYSLLLSLMVVVVIAALTLVGKQLADGLYYSIYRALPWTP
jgi:Flp pilus assembly pilin Flp